MTLISQYVKKMSGGAALPQMAKLPSVILAGLGGMAAIAVVSSITELTTFHVIMAPFGASCFLAFAVPESPLAQPRNIIFGHLVSTAVGLVVLDMMGTGWLAMSIAVGIAIILMQLTRTGHAPAAADPLVVLTIAPSWEFLLYPTLTGGVLIAMVAVIFNNMRPGVRYPTYWW